MPDSLDSASPASEEGASIPDQIYIHTGSPNGVLVDASAASSPSICSDLDLTNMSCIAVPALVKGDASGGPVNDRWVLMSKDAYQQIFETILTKMTDDEDGVDDDTDSNDGVHISATAISPAVGDKSDDPVPSPPSAHCGSSAAAEADHHGDVASPSPESVPSADDVVQVPPPEGNGAHSEVHEKAESSPVNVISKLPAGKPRHKTSNNKSRSRTTVIDNKGLNKKRSFSGAKLSPAARVEAVSQLVHTWQEGGSGGVMHSRAGGPAASDTGSASGVEECGARGGNGGQAGEGWVKVSKDRLLSMVEELMAKRSFNDSQTSPAPEPGDIPPSPPPLIQTQPTNKPVNNNNNNTSATSPSASVNKLDRENESVQRKSTAEVQKAPRCKQATTVSRPVLNSHTRQAPYSELKVPVVPRRALQQAPSSTPHPPECRLNIPGRPGKENTHDNTRHHAPATSSVNQASPPSGDHWMIVRKEMVNAVLERTITQITDGEGGDADVDVPVCLTGDVTIEAEHKDVPAASHSPPPAHIQNVSGSTTAEADHTQAGYPSRKRALPVETQRERCMSGKRRMREGGAASGPMPTPLPRVPQEVPPGSHPQAITSATNPLLLDAISSPALVLALTAPAAGSPASPQDLRTEVSRRRASTSGNLHTVVSRRRTSGSGDDQITVSQQQMCTDSPPAKVASKQSVAVTEGKSKLNVPKVCEAILARTGYQISTKGLPSGKPAVKSNTNTSCSETKCSESKSHGSGVQRPPTRHGLVGLVAVEKDDVFSIVDSVVDRMIRDDREKECVDSIVGSILRENSDNEEDENDTVDRMMQRETGNEEEGRDRRASQVTGDAAEGSAGSSVSSSIASLDKQYCALDQVSPCSSPELPCSPGSRKDRDSCSDMSDERSSDSDRSSPCKSLGDCDGEPRKALKWKSKMMARLNQKDSSDGGSSNDSTSQCDQADVAQAATDQKMTHIAKPSSPNAKGQDVKHERKCSNKRAANSGKRRQQSRPLIPAK